MINPVPLLVADAINRAYANEYFLFSYLSDFEIALDLCSFEKDFEDYEVSDLVPYVEIQRRHYSE